MAILQTYLADGAGGHSIVCLQELVVEKEREQIVEAAARGGLRFNARAESGVPLPARSKGSGVHLLSKWPIVETIAFPSLSNGHTTDLDRFNWHAGKPALLCRVRTPAGDVDCFCLHTCAQWSPTAVDAMDTKPDRTCQIIDAARAVRATARSPLVVLMGDLNSMAHSLEVRLLQRLTGLADTHSWGLGEGTEAKRAYEEPTCDYAGNTWAPAGVMPDTPTRFDANVRLDYIFAANSQPDVRWAVQDACTAFKEPVAAPEGVSCGLAELNVSDHCGLSVTFVRTDDDTRGTSSAALAEATAGHNPVGRPALLPQWPASQPLPLANVWPLELVDGREDDTDDGGAFAAPEVGEAASLIQKSLDVTRGGTVPRRLIGIIRGAVLAVATVAAALAGWLVYDEQGAWGASVDGVTASTESVHRTAATTAVLSALACGFVGMAWSRLLATIGSARPVTTLLQAVGLAAAVLLLPLWALVAWEEPGWAASVALAVLSALLLVATAVWSWILTTTAPSSGTAAKAAVEWLLRLSWDGTERTHSVMPLETRGGGRPHGVAQ